MKRGHSALQSDSVVIGKIGVLLLVFALMLFLPTISSAQDTGYISGTVTDKSGAAVAGAEVTVALDGGSLTRKTETNTDGVYVAAALPAGTYNISVTAKGFQSYEAKGVVLVVAQKARVDVALTVGSVSEKVEVSGETITQVDTQSSELAGQTNQPATTQRTQFRPTGHAYTRRNQSNWAR
jgi:hypothetical protein